MKVAIRQETKTKVETKYKNLQKIHESTEKESNIYKTEIVKLKHEQDTAEGVKLYVMVTSTKYKSEKAKEKEQQIQKL